MPGDLAAAVDVDDRRARIADRPVERAGALAGRIDGLVLKQQARIGDLARHTPIVDLALQVPGFDVADCVVAHPQPREH